MAAQKTASVVAELHPLVIVALADHHTRAKYMGAQEVFGALFGTQNGRQAEICNSFELLVTPGPDGPLIDREYLEQRTAAFKEVFSTYELLGWYTTASEITPTHHLIHRQMLAFTELPLLLTMCTAAPQSGLPVALYEAFLDLNGPEQSMQFAAVPCEIATEEAERIGVEHVAQMLTAGAGSVSETTAHLTGMFNALTMLHTRMAGLRDHLDAVLQGQATATPASLRAIRGLLSRLPVVSSPAFAADTLRESNDVMLTAFLATLTKGCSTMNEFIDHAAMVRRTRW